MTSEGIKQAVLARGADVCGVASVDRFSAAPMGFHPADILPGVRSVVVFGKQFPKSVFSPKAYASHMMIRNSTMTLIDSIAVQLTMDFDAEGIAALPIPSSEPYTYWDSDKREGRGILSLKHAAQLAGLGSIGKNTLLVNRKFGNRLWLGAVLTQAELEEDELVGSLCPANCRICLDACPQQALDGVTIVQKKFREICFSETPGGGALYACSICRQVCPMNQL